MATETELSLLPKKLKPARKQVKPGQVVKSIAPQTGKEYSTFITLNLCELFQDLSLKDIWYNKWAGGDREDSYSNKEKAQTRCNVKRDAGLTRANKTGMKYICLYFARGCCPYGFECEYLHTLPVPSSFQADPSKDCFARDKFADYRDDMGGVGSFGRINRTLYVGRIKETGDGEHTEEVVRRHFGMFGEIDRVRVLQHRSVAFVTFVSEFSGQFAKEAMACQSLDNDEILNVRWATEDPNPTQKVAEKEWLERMGSEAIQGKIDERVVDAVRSIRALEEEVELDDPEDVDNTKEVLGESDPESDEPERKRQRLDTEPLSILKTDTMESLKNFASNYHRRHVVTASAFSTKSQGGLGLGQYGSDDDG